MKNIKFEKFYNMINCGESHYLTIRISLFNNLTSSILSHYNDEVVKGKLTKNEILIVCLLNNNYHGEVLKYINE